MLERGCSYSQPIAYLCSLGLFLAGYVFYSSSLVETFYSAEFHLSSWQIGIAQSAIPLGSIIGALIAGRLADLFGRHRLLNWNFLAISCVGLLGIFVVDFYSLCTVRLLNGFLAGTSYPLCAAYLTEMTPHDRIARQSALLMFINCLASPVGCILAILLCYVCDKHILWRVLSICHVIPAYIGYLWCRKLPESEEWLLSEKKSPQKNPAGWKNLLSGLSILFNASNRNITLCLMGAWFLMDVAYYGINFFVPYLLSMIQHQSTSIGLIHSMSNTTLISTLIINVFFLIGACSAIFIIEKIELITLQKYGFLCSSLSLFLLAIYLYFGWSENYAIVMMFILFNLSLNMGPDITTYLLSAISYPVQIRASAHGFLAGFAKFGSFLGVLFLPRLQELWGHEMVLFFVAVLLFFAYIFTINFSKAIMKDRDIQEGEIIYETN